MPSCWPLVAAFVCAGSATAADFAKDGVAFLQKHCVACHGEKKKNAGVSLHAITDEAGLLKNRKLFQSVLRVLDAGEMPPPERKAQPTVEERALFRSVVGAVFARADRDARPDPGRVTARRLNRTEYANTVRDLTGIDFNPAEDFPADDIGYGFDNIGDVLTLSPVLMERYLSAAEAITARAIQVDLPKPPQRWTGGKYLEPATNPEKVGKFRPITNGNLNTPYTLSMGVTYVPVPGVRQQGRRRGHEGQRDCGRDRGEGVLHPRRGREIVRGVRSETATDEREPPDRR